MGSEFQTDEFVRDYLVECRESLAQFESQLIDLEQDPTSKPLLSSIFRAIHSIKGGSGFLGFQQMVSVSHVGEDLLGRLRDGKIGLSRDITSALLAMCDAMRQMLDSIEATKTEGARNDSALIERLRALLEPAPASPDPVEPVAEAPLPKRKARERRSSASSVASPTLTPAEESRPAEVADTQTGQITSGITDTTIRVDVGLLDRLMNLVGELVLTRNQLLRCSMVRDEAMFQSSTQTLNLITTELQEGMMKTRMQPIRNIWSRLPRVVRDLALVCGKQAKLVTDGEDTELDKTIIEAIKDPITHIVRNALDHGIESAEVRASRGKPAEGSLRLRAFHEAGMVNIEVGDDGGGIDPQRIRRKAVERGWMNQGQADSASDRELLGLIFRPGFSTAESLSTVSGRGVGMDVVKNRVESIGGSVEVSSKPGEGTTIKMKIPLTLTIINALIISTGGDRFAIPQVNLVELIRLRGESLGRDLTSIQGALIGRYRGKLLPLIDLNHVMRVEAKDFERDPECVNIIVLQAERRRFGLIADRIDDAQEIVVRPLARQLKGIPYLAGATIMGDGRIALILDVFGLARQLEDEPEPAALPAGVAESEGAVAKDARRALLVLRGTDGSRLAIPLDHVDRLEAIGKSTVEWVAGRPTVQYRRSLLPLIDVAGVLSGRPWLGGEPTGGEPVQAEGNWQVVIHQGERRQVGLVFDRVVDILEENLDIRGDSDRHGVLFSAAVQGKATEIIDLPAVLAAVEATSRRSAVTS